MITGTGKKETAFAAGVVQRMRESAIEKGPVGEDASGKPVYDMRDACAAERAFVLFFRQFHSRFDESEFRTECGVKKG